jgi:hypothetical protein
VSWQTIVLIVAIIGGIGVLIGLGWWWQRRHRYPQLGSVLVIAFIGCIGIGIAGQLSGHPHEHQQRLVYHPAPQPAPVLLLKQAYQFAVAQGHGRGLRSPHAEQTLLRQRLHRSVEVVTTANALRLQANEFVIISDGANQENMTYEYEAADASIWSLTVIDGGAAEIKQLIGPGGTPPTDTKIVLLGSPITQSGS